MDLEQLVFPVRLKTFIGVEVALRLSLLYLGYIADLSKSGFALGYGFYSSVSGS